MKETKMHLLNYLNGILVIFTTFLSSITLSHPQCGLYGAPPCNNQYLPAPPGHTPKCARPGKTYCEHVDNYPTYLIKHLIHKWGYEAKNLIVDETWTDFNAIKYLYGQHNDQQKAQQHNSNNEPQLFDPTAIFGPQNHLGYNYESPSTLSLKQTNYPGYSEIILPKPPVQETNLLIYNTYSNNNPPNHSSYKQQPKPNIGINFGPKVTQYNPNGWLKRFTRDLNQSSNISYAENNNNLNINNNTRSIRDVSINLDFMDAFGVEKSKERNRVKRQSSGRDTLCESTINYITPQAALNSQGNWMFVVNEPNTARQLVKTELCRSQQCSNLCQLPNGYNSRCEQKFIQKRLVALNGNGQNLYTDTFWFPSCCVCTISNN